MLTTENQAKIKDVQPFMKVVCFDDSRYIPILQAQKIGKDQILIQINPIKREKCLHQNGFSIFVKLQESQRVDYSINFLTKYLLIPHEGSHQ